MTAAGQTMTQWRDSHKATLAQLRRWMYFCRQLSVATKGFATPLAQPLPHAHTRKSAAWMKDRAERVLHDIRAWADGGEMAKPIFPAAPAGVPAREWIATQLPSIYSQKATQQSAVDRGAGGGLADTLRRVRATVMAACPDPRQHAGLVIPHSCFRRGA